MPSLDDLKKRIKSVKSTQKITKAMKMVAAAKLRKAQENAEKGRPYSQKMQNIILNLTKSIRFVSSYNHLINTIKDILVRIRTLAPSRGSCRRCGGRFHRSLCFVCVPCLPGIWQRAWTKL